MRKLIESIEKLYEIGDGGEYKNLNFSTNSIKVKNPKGVFKKAVETVHNLDSDNINYKGVRHKKLNQKNINGTTGRYHDVGWDVKDKDVDSKTPSEKLAHLRQAATLHRNYIDNHTKDGDIVTNTPLDGKSGERSRIYRRYGFSDPHSDDEMQYGRVTTINGQKKLVPYHEHEKEDLKQKTKEREGEAQRRKLQNKNRIIDKRLDAQLDKIFKDRQRKIDMI